MKFLVDAQLPRSLAIFLCSRGHDAIHTLELPHGNDTTDGDITHMSLVEERVVISKDRDFYNSYTAKREPYKLLHIRIGNSNNEALFDLFEKNLDRIIAELDSGFVVEVTQRYIVTIQ